MLSSRSQKIKGTENRASVFMLVREPQLSYAFPPSLQGSSTTLMQLSCFFKKVL